MNDPFPPAASSPRDADILIARTQDAHTIAIVPRPPQLCCRTYEEAVFLAKKWARAQRVTIWFTADGTTFRCVRRPLVHAAS